MNTLIAVGTSVAYLYSVAVTFFPGVFEGAAGAGFKAAVYYDSAVIIIGLILLGRWLEARAKGQTSAAMKTLVGLRAKTARVVRPAPAMAAAAARRGGRRPAPASAAPRRPRPRSRRLPGGRHRPRLGLRAGGAPAGRRRTAPPSRSTSPWTTCSSATSSSCGRARRSPWTAWSSRGAPPWTSRCSPANPSRWRRGPGDEVIGATLNRTGSFRFQATKVGRDTALAQIVRLVEEAQGSKAPIQRMADYIASIFVPVVFGVAIITFLVWYFFGPQPVVTLASWRSSRW